MMHLSYSYLDLFPESQNCDVTGPQSEPVGPAWEPDLQSGYRAERQEAATAVAEPPQLTRIATALAPVPPLPSAPPVRRPPKRHGHRFTADQKRLRALTAQEYCRECYFPEKGLAKSTRGLVRGMFSHLARARGGVLVKELRIELMTELRKYFAGMIADGDQTAENANKNLRQLRALIGFAASEKGDKLVKPIKFTKFFPEKKLKPTMWEPDQLATITAAARATAGDVGGIAASTWWTAWWLAISGIGCRVSALMLAGRDDFKHGVLWLREEHQKQHEDQKFRLKPAAVAAIEDLLAAHDKPYLFPWPHDPGSYRETSEKTNWKTLFRHFEKRLLEPCGITLPKGVKTKMCRRSAATLATENGGSGQRLCGHKSKKTTEKHYMPPGRGIAVINDALLIPDGHCDPKEQLALFQKDEAA